MAAALACGLTGCSAEAIAGGLRGYSALPHRLEHVGTLRGVEFYNDSKATNPAAAAEALGSFEPGKVLLVLGGKDKGADWTELISMIRERARQILLVGQATEILKPLLAGAEQVVDCGTVRNAVRIAFATAEKYMLPALFATLSGMIEVPPAMPAEPRKLSLTAAATPAQAVPCPAWAELSSAFESLSP